jgi:uncharacterized protein (DUF58 family)
MSDFIGDAFRPERLQQPLGVCARRHDTVVVTVNDPSEDELPRLGLIELEDAESGRLAAVDTGDPGLRREFAMLRENRRQEQQVMLRRFGIDRIAVRTNEDFTPQLHRFFQERARRYR